MQGTLTNRQYGFGQATGIVHCEQACMGHLCRKWPDVSVLFLYSAFLKGEGAGLMCMCLLQCRKCDAKYDHCQDEFVNTSG